MLNPICADCVKLGNACKGTHCTTWTGCIYKAKPAPETYTANIRGKWYALKMDQFAHYIFGIGTDSGRWQEINPTPGSTDGRNTAIEAACSPLETWREAYNTAKANGNFIGQLYE